MVSERRDSGQVDPATLARQEKNRKAQAKWRQQHPEAADAANRNNYYKHRKQRIAKVLEWKQQHSEQVQEQGRERYRLQKASLTGGGTVFNEYDYWMSEPVEQTASTPSPLHPIYEQLYQALSKQQTPSAEKPRRTRRRRNP
jgi:hypothetical protein